MEPLEINDLVWAKMRLFPFWPGKVIDPPAGEQREDSYYIFFFGTKDVSWIKRKYVFPYKSKYADSFSQLNRSHAYTKAIKKSVNLYHSIQLNSPTYKQIMVLNGVNPEDIPEVDEEESEEEIVEKPKRIKEDKGKKMRRLKRMREILKARVQLFPEKNQGKDKKKKLLYKKKKLMNVKAVKNATKSESSCILTVNVKDWKKVIRHEVFVHLQRCDDYLPLLKNSVL